MRSRRSTALRTGTAARGGFSSPSCSQGGYWPVNIRVNEDRTRYYDAFAAWNAAGEAGPMTALIAERAAAQLEVVLEACELRDRHPV